MTNLIVVFPRTCLKILGEENVLALFYCVHDYGVYQISIQDVLALLLELNENASCLTCVAMCFGFIIGANISAEPAAYFFTVVSFDYREDDSIE